MRVTLCAVCVCMSNCVCVCVCVCVCLCVPSCVFSSIARGAEEREVSDARAAHDLKQKAAAHAAELERQKAIQEQTLAHAEAERKVGDTWHVSHDTHTSSPVPTCAARLHACLLHAEGPRQCLPHARQSYSLCHCRVCA